MDVADKRKKIVVFVAKDRFIAVLKEMSGAPMTAVEVLSVPREELPHNAGNAKLAALEEKVYMIVHQYPCVDRALSINDVLSKPFKKTRLVLIVFEYIGFIVPTHHNVVQGTGNVEAGLTRHDIL